MNYSQHFTYSIFYILLILHHGVMGAPLQNPFLDDPVDISTVETENTQSEFQAVTKQSLNLSAEAYLFQYGYLSGKSKNSLSSSSYLEVALKKLQKFTGLPVTGKLDSATLEMMERPRCQRPDTGAVTKLRKRFETGAKWPNNELTYDVRSYPTNSYNLQSHEQVDESIATSFKDWSDASNIVIKKLSNNPIIKVDFFAKEHGDGYPFDGKGRVLAHTFLPPYGQLHFDDDETWSSVSFGGPNLRQVGTHEIGHVLGLEHSQDRRAVMYPYYVFNSNFKLGDDDRKAIQYLYGAPKLIKPVLLLDNLIDLPTATTTSTTTMSAPSTTIPATSSTTTTTTIFPTSTTTRSASTTSTSNVPATTILLTGTTITTTSPTISTTITTTTAASTTSTKSKTPSMRNDVSTNSIPSTISDLPFKLTTSLPYTPPASSNPSTPTTIQQ